MSPISVELIVIATMKGPSMPRLSDLPDPRADEVFNKLATSPDVQQYGSEILRNMRDIAGYRGIFRDTRLSPHTISCTTMRRSIDLI